VVEYRGRCVARLNRSQFSEVEVREGRLWAVEFDWDPEKAASNRRKHEVTFQQAATVFADPLATTFPDPDHSLREHRSVTIGM
jgi:hypothetical protein